MTDRVQPGARGSVNRNIEMGEATSQHTDGWVVPAAEPTLSAQRYADVDETQFDEFDAAYGGGSLTVTISAGEAFVDGWLARDVDTDIDLAASTADQDVVIGWNPDAVYDDQTHDTRDDADEAVVDLASNVPDDYPQVVIWTFDTDGAGVTSAVDHRQIGPTVNLREMNADRVSVAQLPPADELGDVPLEDVVDALLNIYDVPAWAEPIYTQGPAHGEGGNAFQGAALAPDGRVVFAPVNSANVGIFDPADDSYTSGPAHGEGGNAFRGAALAPQGLIILCPYNSDNVGVFNAFAQTENALSNALHPLGNGSP